MNFHSIQSTSLFGSTASLVWLAFALAWYLQASGLRPRFPARLRRLGPDTASDPVFTHIYSVGVPTESLTTMGRDFLLARGIPALSGPAGSTFPFVFAAFSQIMEEISE